MTEENDQDLNETYQAVLKKLKAAEDRLESITKKLNETEEVLKQNAEEKKQAVEKVLGRCVACGHALTAADIQHVVCPFCGESSSYRDEP